MIERERKIHGDPEAEARAWAAKLVELGRKRDKSQEMFAAEAMTLDELKAKLEHLKEMRDTAEREFASVEDKHERLIAMEHDRDLILKSYAALAPEALDALSPEERRKVYVILNLTVEPLDGGDLKISGAFGEEPVWETVGTSRRFVSNANPLRLGFTLISRDGSLETAFELDQSARGSIPK
jgi:hypothetical protein